MKKRYILLLTICLLLPLMSMSVEAAGEMKVDAERFMCERLLSNEADFFSREDGSLLISFRRGAPSIRLESPKLEGWEHCNAIRIVLTNNSTCNSLTLSYTIDEESKQIHIPINRRSGKEEYYLYPESIETMTDIQLTFSGGYNGTFELYSIGAVSIYDDSAEEPGEILNCVYRLDLGEVRVSGTVDHDIVINTHDATVELYAFGMGENISRQRINSAKPLASTALSVRFEFAVKQEFFTDRFLQYVVAIMSPEGKLLYSYTPKFPCVEGNESGAVSPSFKGVYTGYTTLSTRADAGTAAVDVYLDLMKSEKNNGLLHIVSGRYFYIDRAYINRLDAIVKQYSADGCRVYLRFLLSGGESYTALHGSAATSGDALYYGISLESDDARLMLFAYTEFLCSRYSEAAFGSLGGIIMGRAVDNQTDYNYVGQEILAEYTRVYGNALYIAAEAVRGVKAEIDVVVPLTMFGGGEEESRLASGQYSPKLFLTSLCKYLEDRFGKGLSIRVMLEDCDGADAVGVSDVENLEAALKLLSTAYGRLERGYIYYWAPNGNAGETTLLNDYVYTYYSLASTDAASMVLSTERLNEQIDVVLLFDTFKYINTQQGFDKNSLTLSDYGAQSWEELIPGFDAQRIVERNVYVYGDYQVPSSDVSGSYILWDHQQGRSIYDWGKGIGEVSLSVEDVDPMGRVLVADMTPSADQAGYSEVIYAYSADEIMSVVDMLSVDIMIDGEEGQLYTLIFEICGDQSSCEVSAEVESGARTMVYLSTLKLDKSDHIRNIRMICAPRESEASYRLCIGQLSAHSNSLNDKALEQAIVEARLESMTEKDMTVKQNRGVQTAAVVAVLMLCIGAFVLIAMAKREE